MRPSARFDTARDLAHLHAFSHAAEMHDRMRDRPVSIADFGGMRMFGDEQLGWEAAAPGTTYYPTESTYWTPSGTQSSTGSTVNWNAVTGLTTALTGGAAAIIGALQGPPTVVNVGQPQGGLYPAGGGAYPGGSYRPMGSSSNDLMLYLALGGAALLGFMMLTKKSAPKAG